ncbi:MAG TPA: MMPL family transporter [Enhygromyxa sp.]|nr:MMPL family transporter [Enhygromyxa sp.]
MSARESGPSVVTRLLARSTAALLRNRSLVLASVALMLFVAALGTLRLRVDFSSTAFYGDDSEPARRFAEFSRRWGADDADLLVLIGCQQPDGVLAPERLAAIAELAAALERGDQVRRVTSIAQLPPQLRELAIPTLLAADGRTTAIVVELEFSSDDVMRTRAVVDALEPILAAHDPALAELGLTRELAGVPAIRAGFFALVIRDQAIFIPLSLTIIGLALLLVFRRLHGVLIPAVAAAVPTLMLVGVMGWIGEPIGLLNQAYFTLLPVILVADAIHMIARFHEELRGDASDGPADLDLRRRAIVRASSRVGLACLLTSLTTGIGFASLSLATMPILRSFGLYAALGVSLGLLMVMILVPVMLSFVDDRGAPPLPGLCPIDAAVSLAIARPRLLLLVTAALLGAAVIPASRVEIDNTLSGLLDDDHPTSVASRRVDRELGGVLGLEFELEAPAGVDLRDPELLATMHGFERWLAAQPEVRSVEGLATIVATLGPLAEHAPLDRYIRDHDQDPGRFARIHAGLPDAGGRQFVAFAGRAEAELERRLAGTGVRAHATGTPLLAYQGVNRITDDLRTSFALVFAVVVGLTGLLFRSVWPAIVAILPNGLPLALGYATIGLLGEVLDPLAAVILTLALGIAVDDTLHVMVRTREELRTGVGVDQALRRAIEHSGRAVAVTSIVIAGGLALNLLSSFPPLQMLGLLGAVVISVALLADLLVLPALLVLLRGRGLEPK